MHYARTVVDVGDGPQPRLLASADPSSGWVDVRTAERLRLVRLGATHQAAARVAAAVVPGSLSEALSVGPLFQEACAAAVSAGDAPVAASTPLVNALDPAGYRDFMTFERHFSFGYRWQGKPVPEVMYELPVSYCGNPLAFIGPDDEVPWPHYSEHLDYELELGIVIGRPGTNLTPDEALQHVAGLTILNDVSARDIQAREMTGGLGPSKGKHFACAVGPWVTSLDELDLEAGLVMQTRVNGETWNRSTTADMIWSIAELVAWTSQAEELVPGMLLGSGTCNEGCTLEIGKRLAPGDLVELEIEGLGVLRNRYGHPSGTGWTPAPRAPAIG
ncbi:fumarylacetoacetate hydrolase family protein [Aeromicrobium sp. NPDC092404]|uniref:fumarylacetoacetate hydrolase family protein n=1 Tax=Aeromicrobium sp. NPDC092404 TaxID=3154976 RepID=UPI00341B37AA